ncbi:MAG: hypothetical protein KIS85_03455 [Anaerolineales bacterium]|nr:hypothetical protein [Anaerolineales bacterium]
MERQWIKASEIGEYLYCRRAWWYRLQGAASANLAAMQAGGRAHTAHGRGLRVVAALRLLALGLALVAGWLLLSQWGLP